MADEHKEYMRLFTDDQYEDMNREDVIVELKRIGEFNGDESTDELKRQMKIKIDNEQGEIIDKMRFFPACSFEVGHQKGDIFLLGLSYSLHRYLQYYNIVLY